MTNWNDLVIEQFLAGNERIADQFDRSDLVLLDTVGARSGESRVSPVAGFADGDRLFVVASAAGRDQHPAWYHNLLAHPTVRVRRWQDGELVSYQARAMPLAAAERDDVYHRVVVPKMPGFAEYQQQTSRVIPVVALTREPASA
jgi:deazaflavin-dependent oxidoreductase (nitroreductase family)